MHVGFFTKPTDTLASFYKLPESFLERVEKLRNFMKNQDFRMRENNCASAKIDSKTIESTYQRHF